MTKQGEIPSNWVTQISDEELREIAIRLVHVGLRIPHLKQRVLELVWLICVEDKRVAGVKW